uniref:EF-hand domain-containing protein n=1 Tax=Noctiluca scintillans TaxID=2966 RepID=A0A7S1F4B3_NOCSC
MEREQRFVTEITRDCSSLMLSQMEKLMKSIDDSHARQQDILHTSVWCPSTDISVEFLGPMRTSVDSNCERICAGLSLQSSLEAEVDRREASCPTAPSIAEFLGRPSKKVERMKMEFHKANMGTKQGHLMLEAMAQSLPDHSHFKHAALVCTNIMKVSCEVATRDRFHLHSVRKLVSSAAFKSFIMCMILLNVILIAYITNSTVKNSFDNFHLRQMGSTVEHRVPLFLEEIDFAFCIIFTVEVALRIAASEVLFFVGPDMSWNIFDLLVVSMSLANVVFGGSTSSPVLVRLLRLSRVGRTFRSVWILRTLPSLYKLRFMILAIINSLGALFWGSALIALVVYIWAVVLIMVVSQYVEGAQASDATISSLDEYFGSLPIALATLYMSITGGIDWEDIFKPLLRIHTVVGLLYVAFVLFSTLAVMNVIASIFVSDAVQVAQYDNDLRMRGQLMETRRQLTAFTEIFNEMDVQNSGEISLNEFLIQMERDDVRLLLAYSDVNVADAVSFFKLLDSEKNNKLNMEEFVMGCLRMNGTANLIDMEVAVQETNVLTKKVLAAQRRVEDRVHHVEQCLGAKGWRPFAN